MRPLALPLSLLLLAACGDDDSASIDAHSSTDGVAGGPDASGGFDAAPWTPPTTVAACGAPTVAAGLTLTTPVGAYTAPQLAWGGTEGAVAFVATGSGGAVSVQLQRLDGAGNAVGDVVDVGTTDAGVMTQIGLATDGQRYVACWAPFNGDGALSCAAVPVSSGAVTTGLTATGRNPSVAFGAGGFILAYHDATGVVVQKLTTNASADGGAIPVHGGSADDVGIAATPSGYAVAWGITESGATHGSVTAQRLALDLSLAGGAITVASSWHGYRFHLAASSERLGVVFAEPGAGVSTVVVQADGTAGNRVRIDDPTDSSYGQVGLAGGVDSFAASWSAFMGYIGYRGVDGSGTALGSFVHAMDAGWDDNANAVVGVTDGFLVAAAVGMGSNEIAVVHLACP